MSSECSPRLSWGTSIVVVLVAALSALVGLAIVAGVANAAWVGPGERQPDHRGLAVVGVIAVVTFGVGLTVRTLRVRARVFLPVATVLGTTSLIFGTVAVLVFVLWDDAGRVVPTAFAGVLLSGLVLSVVLVRRHPSHEDRERFLAWVVPISLLVAIGALTPWAGVGRALMPSHERHALAVTRFGPSYVGAIRTVRGCRTVLEGAAPSSVVVSPFRGKAHKRRDGESGTYHFRLGGGVRRSASVSIVAQPEPGVDGAFRFVSRNGDPSVVVEVREWPRPSPTRVRCPVASNARVLR